ncbi:hypothetical protein B0T26DRAFT_869973, partial [Lasiosphaeria miniovina]
MLHHGPQLHQLRHRRRAERSQHDLLPDLLQVAARPAPVGILLRADGRRAATTRRCAWAPACSISPTSPAAVVLCGWCLRKLGKLRGQHVWLRLGITRGTRRICAFLLTEERNDKRAYEYQREPAAHCRHPITYYLRY